MPGDLGLFFFFFLMPRRLCWQRPHPKGWDCTFFILLFPEPTLVPSIRACMLNRFSHVQLCDPMDSSPPGSSVQGILQARALEWVLPFPSPGKHPGSPKCPLVECILLLLSHSVVPDSVTPWPVAPQAPLSMGISR